MNELYQKILKPNKICSREDHLRRKNCEGNPWCSYGLGENKDGIWKNHEFCLEQLCGRIQTVRALSIPAGLKNCGATCYLSVIFQSLFHNLLWRNALLQLRTTDVVNQTSTDCSAAPAERDVFDIMILKLKSLFIQMEHSILPSVNPNGLIDCFGVDKQVQQDPQEFLALFFERFSNIEVGNLLLGKEEQQLQCEGCKCVRRSMLPFNSIQLSVTKNKTIQDAINEYSSPEVLADPSLCPNCHHSTFMAKSMIISDTPPILLIHLLRYEYDRERGSKKKIQNEFEFSDELVVNDEQYVLASVVYHIGTSAHGGHYVCDCRIWKDNRWFHLDDETSTEIPSPCSTASRDAAGNDTVKESIDLTTGTDSGTSTTGRKRKRSKKNDDTIDQNQQIFSLLSPSLNRKKDCYLLFYVRKSLVQDAVGTFDTVRQQQSLLPLVATVIEQNRTSEESVAQMKITTDQWIREFERRKEIYYEIQSSFTPPDANGDFLLVNAEKLKQWVIGDPFSFKQSESGTSANIPHDNKEQIGDNDVEIVEVISPNSGKKELPSIRCAHGKINPKSLSNFKVLSKVTYEKIIQSYSSLPHYKFDESGVAPFLPIEATRDTLICYECGSDREQSSQSIIAEQLKIGDLLKAIQDDIEMFEGGSKDKSIMQQQKQGGCWLSKKFFQELKKYSTKLTNEMVKYANSKDESTSTKVCTNVNKKIDIVTVESLRASSFSQRVPLNSKVLCEDHGQLSLDVEDQSVVISEVCMKWIESLFEPCVVCPTNMELCKECSQKREDKELSTNQHEMSRQDQKNDPELMELFKRKGLLPPELVDVVDKGKNAFLETLDPNISPKFFLINCNWMDQWRAFIRFGNNKTVNKLCKDSLVCHHGKLCANDLLCLSEGQTKYTIDQLNEHDQLQHVEVVRPNEFHKLSLLYSEKYGGGNGNGENMLSSDLPMWPSVQLMKNSKYCAIAYDPELCTECLTERLSLFQSNTKFFQNAALTVLYFGSKEMMTEFQRKRDSGQKVIIRSRGSSLQKFSVTSSHDDTVGLMKLKMFESCQNIDLMPAQIILFDELGNELKDNNKSLADYEIRSDNMIFVVKSEGNGSGWVDGFYECYQPRNEEGFKGGIWNVHQSSCKEGQPDQGYNGSSSSSSSSSQTTSHVIEIID